MPLYEYECESCQARFERLQKVSEPPEAHCPRCGGRAQRRLSPPALQFKGTGWYVTDYARRNAGPHSGNSLPVEKTESAETKSESKKPAESKTTAESKPSTD